MLPDLERKLHRILVNYPSPIHSARVPNFKQLENKTGRRRADILKGLKYLEDNGYIVWPDKYTTKGIEVLKHETLDKVPTAPLRIQLHTGRIKAMN